MSLRSRSLLTAFALAVLALGAGNVARASSHREALAISKDPTADNTDVYAFVSPDKPNTVTLISNWAPFLEPAGGPNFYQFDDDAHYYIIVDNVGDARDHIVYEFKFKTEVVNGNTFLYNTGPIRSLTDPNYNVRQYYDVIRWDNGRKSVLGTHIPCPPNRVGDASTPDYNSLARQAVRTLSDGSKVFAGERDDPFFVDLGATFDLLTIRKVPGNQGFGVDGLGGFNTLTIALQVPKDRLTRDGRRVDGKNGIIGVYSTTGRVARDGDDDGKHRDLHGESADFGARLDGGQKIQQVSRLGSPLVNEVVIPLKDKDRWNRSDPRDDGQFLSYVVKPELGGLLKAIYNIDSPPAPRNDLVAVFLTGVPGLTQPAGVRPAEFLRLNMAIPPTPSPKRLGVLAGDLAGFPNGRRLEDDVVDIELRAVAGVLVPGFDIAPNNQLGDGVDVNDRAFLGEFPYVPTPHNGLTHGHHRREPEHPALVAATAPAEGLEITEVESTDLTSDPEAAPPAMRISGPNPSKTPRLEYSIGRSARVGLKIFDLQGREVRSLLDQNAAPGSVEVAWDGKGNDGSVVGKGVFFARFTVDGTLVNIRKLVVQ